MRICDIGAERLLIAVYVCACSDLLVAYTKGADFDARQLESWIYSDPYGFLTNPDGIIKAVRKKQEMGAKAFKVPDFAKEGGKALRKLEYRQIRMQVMRSSR